MTHQLFNLPRTNPLNNSAQVTPGARVRFYLTGTTTPTPVYTTSALSVAHTQPVEADATGRLPVVYLDPAIAYKVTISDAADVLLYTVDPVNDNVLSQAVIGAYLYPRTAAEIAAGVMPVYYYYPPGNILRYGADASGIANSSSAVQAAVNLNLQDGTEVRAPAGRYLMNSGVGLSSRVKILGDGNKDTVFVTPSGGGGISVFYASTLAAYNDGIVLEDIGIILNNANDIGVDCTSISRLCARSVRVWGDESQVLVRGTGFKFEAPTISLQIYSCYANNLYDCDIRNCLKGVHIRNGANANMFYGGQIINCTDNIYQEGAGSERIDNCGFFGVRSEVTAGNALHITGDVWGWNFTGCRFEAYNTGDVCIRMSGGDAALPPTVFNANTVGTSGGATAYHLSGLTGRILINGQFSGEYTDTSGTGAYHLGLGRLVVGNPFASSGGTIQPEDSTGNAALNLSGQGNGAVKSQSAFVRQISTITYSASMTPNAIAGNYFIITATNGTAFAINSPSNLAALQAGQALTIVIRNTSGGALGAVTWDAAYRMSAWTQPANGFSRSITFTFDGSNLVQESQTGVDVPN